MTTFAYILLIFNSIITLLCSSIFYALSIYELFPAFYPKNRQFAIIRKTSCIISWVFLFSTIITINIAFPSYFPTSFHYLSYIYIILFLLLFAYTILIYKGISQRIYAIFLLMLSIGIAICASNIIAFSLAGEFGNFFTPLHIITYALVFLATVLFSANFLKITIQKDAITKNLLTLSHESLIFFALFMLAFPVIGLKFISHLFLFPGIGILFFVLILCCIYLCYFFSQKQLYRQEFIATCILFSLSIIAISFMQYPYLIYPVVTITHTIATQSVLLISMITLLGSGISIYTGYKLMQFGRRAISAIY